VSNKTPVINNNDRGRRSKYYLDHYFCQPQTCNDY